MSSHRKTKLRLKKSTSCSDPTGQRSQTILSRQLAGTSCFNGLVPSLTFRAVAISKALHHYRWSSPQRTLLLHTLRYSSRLQIVTGISFPPFFSSMLGNPGRVKSNPRSSTEQPFIVKVSNAYRRLSLVQTKGEFVKYSHSLNYVYKIKDMLTHFMSFFCFVFLALKTIFFFCHNLYMIKSPRSQRK